MGFDLGNSLRVVTTSKTFHKSGRNHAYVAMIAAKLHRVMIDNNLNGLRGDQRRQAIPTLKGYAYQIWQSLYRWVTLKEDSGGG
jgi:hypothetical protein